MWMSLSQCEILDGANHKPEPGQKAGFVGTSQRLRGHNNDIRGVRMNSMPVNRLLSLSIVSTFLLAPANAQAMRCGTSLVTEGDTQEEVLRNCGEPVQTNSRYITRGASYSNLHFGNSISGSTRGQYFFAEEVLVEEWIFNFGPNKLMRKVSFENGIVADVQTLDYGYRE
jgi:hypothetical protein